MKPHGSALLSFVAVFALVSAGACSLVPAARPTATGTSRAPTPTVTLAPTASVGPATTPRTTPLTEETAAPTPPQDGDGPPAGLLRSGDEAAAGYPGSYCFEDTCADIGGWPPKSSLRRLNASDNGLDFSIAHDLPFVSWSAAYSEKSNDDRSKPLGESGTHYDPDAIGSPPQFVSASIPRPPAGDWVVWVWVDLEFGDLSYAWHVIVD